MNKISNDIINQYLDGELDYEKKIATEKLLTNSSKDKKEYLLLLQLDKNLRKIKSKKPSKYFTLNLMNKLSVKTIAQRKQSRFIMGIITILMLPILFITSIIIYNLFSNYNTIGFSLIYLVKNTILIWLENANNHIFISPVSLLWICLFLILSISMNFLLDEFIRLKYYIVKLR